MTALALSRRDRRTLIAGCVVVGALAFLSRGVPAIVRWRNALDARTSEFTRQSEAAATAARLLPERRDSLRARLARLRLLDSSLIVAPSSAEAAAQLAAVVEDLAESSLVKVSTLQLRADSAAAGGLVRAFVRLGGTTDVVGLAEFLQAVEDGDVRMRVAEAGVTQPEPAAPDVKPEMLRVDLLIESLVRITPPVATRRTAARDTVPPLRVADAVELLASADPFRLSNSAARVRYNPASEAAVGPALLAPSIRPVLVLKAIVGGPPWRAVVDGVPGQPSGTVAEQGSRFDKLLVRSVTRDSVTIQGPDTTWVLGFRKR